jgi:polar amino acid transport system substrate-binding protein
VAYCGFIEDLVISTKTMIFSFLISAVLWSSPVYSEAENESITLIVCAFEYKPYSYRDDGGHVTGAFIDKAKQFLDQTDLQYEITILPFTRALQQVESRSDVLLVGLARTDERENAFHWLSELATIQMQLITRNDLDLINLTKQEIIEGDYSAACVASSIQCELLQQFGFPDNKIIRMYDASSGIYAQLLLRNRADFVIAEMDGVEAELSSLGERSDALVPIFNISEGVTYIAAPKSLDPGVLEILRSLAQSD